MKPVWKWGQLDNQNAFWSIPNKVTLIEHTYIKSWSTWHVFYWWYKEDLHKGSVVCDFTLMVTHCYAFIAVGVYVRLHT